LYIDVIGVPRGVPDEFKARNQIAAGFESALFWWSTIYKNVCYINYIYCNHQKIFNYTREAVKGIAEQLGPTSKVAWENRMVLDMILAEKRRECVLVGGKCYIFIPNNTAPDRTITKALQSLKSCQTNWLRTQG
jgi:hypothetical protein